MRRSDRTHKKSATRSATMKGRPSLRKGERQAPRQSLTIGLVKRPSPDPNKKPWPQNCVVIVAASPATVRVSQIRGRIIDKACRDCGARLCVDSVSIDRLFSDPIRQGRRIEYLGLDCCFGSYETENVTMIPARRKSESGACNE